LQGGAGDDTLNGGLGADSLTGGAGNDVFVWRAADAGQTPADVITDLAVGDAIRIQGLTGLQWRVQDTQRSATTLDAWLGASNGRTVLYVETVPDAKSSDWVSLEIASGIRTRGWVATESSQELFLTIPVNVPSVLIVPSSSEKLPLTASGKGASTLISGVSVQDADGTLWNLFSPYNPGANGTTYSPSYQFINSVDTFVDDDGFLNYTAIDGDFTLVTTSGGTVNPVPIPAAAWLLLSGVGGLFMAGRRRSALASAR